jgi:hypothetical protein
MTYGHSTRVSAVNALTQRVLDRQTDMGGYQAWSALDPEKRLQLVERALATPANDIIDDFPLAL